MIARKTVRSNRWTELKNSIKAELQRYRPDPGKLSMVLSIALGLWVGTALRGSLYIPVALLCVALAGGITTVVLAIKRNLHSLILLIGLCEIMFGMSVFIGWIAH